MDTVGERIVAVRLAHSDWQLVHDAVRAYPRLTGFGLADPRLRSEATR